jgi:DNA-binding response OmpR family regulator
VFEEIGSTILSPGVSHRAAQVFTLPEILPAHTRIVLDVEARLVLLLMFDEKEPVPLVRPFQLSSSAVRVFLALLQAYPQYCQYQTLFSALYPVTFDPPTPIWEHYVRPIRRALRYLTPVLQAFGLAVVALRGRGYLLTPCTRGTNFPATP